MAVFDVSIDPAYIANAVLIVTFILTICLYIIVRRDLNLVQRALFP